MAGRPPPPPSPYPANWPVGPPPSLDPRRGGGSQSSASVPPASDWRADSGPYNAGTSFAQQHYDAGQSGTYDPRRQRAQPFDSGAPPLMQPQQQQQPDAAQLLNQLAMQGFSVPTVSDDASMKTLPPYARPYDSDDSRPPPPPMSDDPVERYRRQWQSQQGGNGNQAPPRPLASPAMHQQQQQQYAQPSYRTRHDSNDAGPSASGWTNAAAQYQPYPQTRPEHQQRYRPADSRSFNDQRQSRNGSGYARPPPSQQQRQHSQPQARHPPPPPRADRWGERQRPPSNGARRTRSRSPLQRRRRDPRSHSPTPDPMQTVTVSGLTPDVRAATLHAMLDIFCDEKESEDLERPVDVLMCRDATTRGLNGRAVVTFDRIAHARRFVSACGEHAQMDNSLVRRLYETVQKEQGKVDDGDTTAERGPLHFVHGPLTEEAAAVSLTEPHGCIRVADLHESTTAEVIHNVVSSDQGLEAVLLLCDRRGDSSSGEEGPPRSWRMAFIIYATVEQSAKRSELSLSVANGDGGEELHPATLSRPPFSQSFVKADAFDPTSGEYTWTDAGGVAWMHRDDKAALVVRNAGNGAAQANGREDDGERTDNAPAGGEAVADGSAPGQVDTTAGAAVDAAALPLPSISSTSASATSPPASKTKRAVSPSSAAAAQTAVHKKMAVDIARWEKKQAELHGRGGGGGDAADLASSDAAAAPTAATALTPSDSMYYIDTSALSCYLCVRKFKLLDVLLRHERESELHKTNMADEAKRQNGQEVRAIKLAEQRKAEGEDAAATATATAPAGEAVKYRNRASERRAVFGLSGGADVPKSKFTQVFAGPTAMTSSDAPPSSALPSSEPSDTNAAPAISEDASNIGNILLRSMGWTEGQGIGVDGKGIDKPIEAVRYASGAGIGSSAPSDPTQQQQQRYESMTDHAREDRKKRYYEATQGGEAQ